MEIRGGGEGQVQNVHRSEKKKWGGGKRRQSRKRLRMWGGERRRCDERMRGKMKGSNGGKQSQTVLEKAEKVSLIKAVPKLAFKVPLEGRTGKKKKAVKIRISLKLARTSELAQLQTHTGRCTHAINTRVHWETQRQTNSHKWS